VLGEAVQATRPRSAQFAAAELERSLAANVEFWELQAAILCL